MSQQEPSVPSPVGCASTTQLTTSGPAARFVDLTDVRLNMGGDLGLQRDREHLPGRVTDQLVEHRSATDTGGVLVGLLHLLDYVEHGCTFPSRRANVDPDQNLYWASILLGRCVRFTSPRRAPSTGSAHCSTEGANTASAGEPESAGCLPQTQEIRESSDFVPYEERLTRSLAEDSLNVTSVSATREALPDNVPSTMAALPISAFDVEEEHVTVAYGREFRSGQSRSFFLAEGGLVYSVSPGVRGESFAEALAVDADTGHRVVLVPVGAETAALTWADPDRFGVREHHVIWTTAEGLIINLMGVREPEALVDVARTSVC